MSPVIDAGEAEDGTPYLVMPSYKGDSIGAIHDSILEEEPPTLAAVFPGVPSALSRAVTKALAKSPRQRLPNVKRLAEAALE